MSDKVLFVNALFNALIILLYLIDLLFDVAD
jgi:hypothetical protein